MKLVKKQVISINNRNVLNYSINLQIYLKVLQQSHFLTDIFGYKADEFNIKIINFIPQDNIDNWEIEIIDTNHNITYFNYNDINLKELITTSDIIQINAKNNNKYFSGKLYLEISFNAIEKNMFSSKTAKKLYNIEKQVKQKSKKSMVALPLDVFIELING